MNKIVVTILVLCTLFIDAQAVATCNSGDNSDYCKFYTHVEEGVIVQDDGDGVDVEIPCQLRYNNQSFIPDRQAQSSYPYRVDLTWYSVEPPSTVQTNLYIWENSYDATIQDPRITRKTESYEEIYYLQIQNFTEIDARRQYCCYLHMNLDPSSIACTNFMYRVPPGVPTEVPSVVKVETSSYPSFFQGPYFGCRVSFLPKESVPVDGITFTIQKNVMQASDDSGGSYDCPFTFFLRWCENKLNKIDSHCAINIWPSRWKSIHAERENGSPDMDISLYIEFKRGSSDTYQGRYSLIVRAVDDDGADAVGNMSVECSEMDLFPTTTIATTTVPKSKYIPTSPKPKDDTSRGVHCCSGSGINYIIIGLVNVYFAWMSIDLNRQ